MSADLPRGHAPTELLSTWLDRQVEPTEAEPLERHLAECGACRDELAELGAVRNLLRSLPDVPPPRSFALAPPVESARFSRFLPWTRGAAAIAAAVFVVFLSLDLLGAGSANGVPLPRFLQNRTGGPTVSPIVAVPAARPGEAASSVKAAQADAPKPTDAPGPTQAARPAAEAAKPAAAAPAATDSAAGSAVAPTSVPVEAALAAAPGLQPLRIVSIATGALALFFALVALVLGRRASTGRTNGPVG